MRKEYVITILLLAVLAAYSAPVSAEYCADLSTAIKGTGDVYVGGGHGLNTSPYQQDFDIPSGNVKWARLYTGVWASGNSPGWINISFCNGTGCTDHDAYVTTSHTGGSNTEDDGYYVACGYGNYWYYWNVTNIVSSGTTNNATVTTEDFNVGDVSGAVLIVVYEDGGKYYWVNQGYVYLGTGDTTCGCRKAESTTTFSGTMDDSANATLWTGYFVGEPSPEKDILEFNGYQFDVADTADGSGATSDSSWTNKRLDVDKWDIHQNWIDTASNSLKFIRDSDTATRAVLAVFLNETPAPDLKVTGIDELVEQDGQTPTALVANQNYPIDVTVQNIGNNAAGAFDLTFKVGTQTNTTNLATGLGAGDENVSTYHWTPPSGGSYNLNATADAGGAVTESDEDNNATTKLVTVLAAGTANLAIVSGDITFHPAYANHTANNNTIVRVKVRNDGAGDAGSAGSMFKVQLVTSSGSVNKTTWLRAKCYRFVEFETTLPEGSNSVTVNLDPDDTVAETSNGDNSAGNTVDIVEYHILDTHHYGDDSTYNGPMSGNTDVEMFDVVKLAPEGANPVELLRSVANSTTPGDSTPIKSVDGLTHNDTMRYYWYPFVNGIPVPWGEGGCEWETYQLHEGDTIRWEFLKYVNSPSADGFKARPVMDYPEPFVHGYNETVYSITIVYPDELLCYQDKADAIESGLVAAGVSGGIISKKAVGDVTSSDKQNNNLILLGTPSNNPIIADINSQRLTVGLPVYFSGNQMIDDSDDTAYDVGGVIEACDNPYDGADWKDTGPSVWLAAAVEDYWAYKAADLLADDPDMLDRFWTIREPYLVPTWDGTDVTLDWGNWTGTCTSFDIYITNNLTAGFPASPNATVSATSWSDTNAGADLERYYKVTCGAGGEQIEGNVSKIAYELEKGAIYGVNWVTLPSTSPPITDADAMIKSIPGITHITGDNVKWWNFTSQQAESYFKTPVGYGGTNFAVKPVRGYEVSIGVDTTWTVVGWVPPTCQIKLKKGAIYGVNWIGMPFDTTTDDADAMIKSIPGITHLTGDNVKWWNFTSQQAESYFKTPVGYGGTNFAVKPVRGYEVSIGVDTIWTPQ